MTEHNKEIITRLRAASDLRDEETVEELVSDAFVAHVAGMPDADKATWKRNVGMFYEAFTGLRGPILDIVAGDDKVVVRVEFKGTHTGEFLGVPASGNDIQFQGYFTFRLSEGKVVEEWGLMDMFGLMSQIGAIPSS